MKMRNVIILMMGVLLFDKAYSQVKKKPLPTAAAKQQNPFVPKTKLFAVARAVKEEILIRWAPENYGGWNLCNKYGYAIEKFTIVKNNKLLQNFESSQPKIIIKPKPLEAWDSLINNRPLALNKKQRKYSQTLPFKISFYENNSAFKIFFKTFSP